MSDPAPPQEASDGESNPTPEPAPEFVSRPLLGTGFWLMIAFAVLCLTAALVVGLYGPRLFPAHLRRQNSPAETAGGAVFQETGRARAQPVRE